MNILSNSVNPSQVVFHGVDSLFEISANRQNFGHFSEGKLTKDTPKEDADKNNLGKCISLTVARVENFSGHVGYRDASKKLEVKNYAILFGVLNKPYGSLEAGMMIYMTLPEWTAKALNKEITRAGIKQYRNPKAAPFALEVSLGPEKTGANKLYPLNVASVPMPDGCEYYGALVDVDYPSAKQVYGSSIDELGIHTGATSLGSSYTYQFGGISEQKTIPQDKEESAVPPAEEPKVKAPEIVTLPSAADDMPF
jgi:hypothetical protein